MDKSSKNLQLESMEKMLERTLYLVTLLTERLIKGKIQVPEVWYDNQAVMFKLHISASTLKRRRNDGTLRYKKLRGKYYYREADVLAAMMNKEGEDSAGRHS